MNQSQLEILSRKPKIRISELENKSDRTLLFGTLLYNTIKISFHLYMKQEMFHFTAYNTSTNTPLGPVFPPFKYREDITSNMFITSGIDEKKIQHFYPECCDYEFCNLLKLKGVLLDFKKLDKDRPTKTFYGILYEELKNNK